MRLRHWIFLGILVLLVGAILAEVATYRAIRRQAGRDEARPADAIVVFGAAEYNGQPSPVFKSRLDHALELEERGLAPLMMTTGGSGGDTHYTEGGVGRDYLIQQGVAAAKILSDTKSDSTYQNVQAVAHRLKARGLHTCIAVSDGFHLYRIKLMFIPFGIIAYASPAPASPIEADSFERTMFSLREMLLVSLWRLGFPS